MHSERHAEAGAGEARTRLYTATPSLEAEQSAGCRAHKHRHKRFMLLGGFAFGLCHACGLRCYVRLYIVNLWSKT
jgi:hypothetical protein